MSNIAFIIGAGRSGTTLLYKLLALHPAIRVITNYDVHLGRWSPAGPILRLMHQFPQIATSVWFRPGGAAHFQHGLRRLFPLPVEGEPIYARSGIPLMKPATDNAPQEVIDAIRIEFDRMRKSTGASVFVTKRTANNRRIGWLKQAFPDAKFIHLMRDGRDVAYSLSNVRFWREHSVWWAGCKPGELEASGWEPLKICAKNWVEDVKSVERGLADVAPEQQMMIKYERLLKDWENTPLDVCEFLGLSNSEKFMDAVRSLGIHGREPKWRQKWSDSELNTVMSEQFDVLSNYGYT